MKQEGERVKEVFLVRRPCPIIFVCSCLPPPIRQTGSSSKLLALLSPWPWEQSGDGHKQAASQPAATFVPLVALKSTAGKHLGNLSPFFFFSSF